MESMTGTTGYSPLCLIIDRFGLNADFIKRQRLSWTNNLITSSGEDLANRHHPDHCKPYVQNYIQQFGARKVEANATTTTLNPSAMLRPAPVLICHLWLAIASSYSTKV